MPKPRIDILSVLRAAGPDIDSGDKPPRETAYVLFGALQHRVKDNPEWRELSCTCEPERRKSQIALLGGRTCEIMWSSRHTSTNPSEVSRPLPVGPLSVGLLTMGLAVTSEDGRRFARLRAEDLTLPSRTGWSQGTYDRGEEVMQLGLALEARGLPRGDSIVATSQFSVTHPPEGDETILRVGADAHGPPAGLLKGQPEADSQSEPTPDEIRALQESADMLGAALKYLFNR